MALVDYFENCYYRMLVEVDFGYFALKVVGKTLAAVVEVDRQAVEIVVVAQYVAVEVGV